jgi:hypothetical protein
MFMDICQMGVALVHAERRTRGRTHKETDVFFKCFAKAPKNETLASRIRACADGTVRCNLKKDTRMSFQSTNKEANKNQNIFCLVNKVLSYSIYSAKENYDINIFYKEVVNFQHLLCFQF